MSSSHHSEAELADWSDSLDGRLDRLLRANAFSPFGMMGRGFGRFGGVGGGHRDPILSIFADGTDGWVFDGSKTDQTFQESWGNTAADTVGQSIGLGLEGHAWSGQTLSAVIAAAANRVTSMSLAGGRNANSSIDSQDANGITVHSVAAGSYGINFPTITGVVGDTSYLAITLTSSATRAVTIGLGGGSSSGIVLTAGVPLSVAFRPTAIAATAFDIFISASGAGETLTASAAVVKKIPGHAGLQSNSGSRPTRQANGVYRFDGVDDNLPTTLVPGSVMTLMGKFKITSAAKVMMGSLDGTGNRCFIGTSSGGLLAGGVGTQSTATINGGSDIRGAVGVGALVADGTTVKLYWNAVQIYSAAQSGTTANAIPIPIGAVNSNGTPGSFADADASFLLAIKKALQLEGAAGIRAITNKWGTS